MQKFSNPASGFTPLEIYSQKTPLARFTPLEMEFRGRGRGFLRRQISSRKKSLTGFTLIELIIVLVIISLVVAITTSSYLSARVQGNEGATKGALRSIQSSCISYRSTTGAYPTSLVAMGSSYLGGGLEAGTKSGYVFSLSNGNSGETFTCTAVPQTANYTGVKSYCTDTANVIYAYNAATIAADGTACPPGGTALGG